jgi:hypothetical protein
MNRKVSKARILILGIGAVLYALLIGLAPASGQEKIKEFLDEEYGYVFKYPAGWNIRKLPEGAANKQMRVMLQGPDGSSFIVVVENLGQKTLKEAFENSAERKKRIDALMSQTLEQIYKTVSRNMKATHMTIGERRDLSNERAIQFYISTLHATPVGKPIIVAGIHTLPFGKEYALNFVMTAFWDESQKADNELLLVVFNSFRLLGESKSSEPPSPDKSPEVPRSNP